MICNSKTTQAGFSLVETLVAITIVLIVIVGPMTIISSASRSTSFSSEQVIAFFLAQEGAELAQKARDDLVLAEFDTGSTDAWDTFTAGGGIYQACFSSGGCGLEMSSENVSAPIACDSAGSCRLRFEPPSGNGNVVRSPYTYNRTQGLEETAFTRTINFTAVSANEVRVTSRVEWFSGLSREGQSAEVETSLFNVYDPD